MRFRFLRVAIVLPAFFLTGCIGEIQGFICALVPDSDHCYQGSAGQQGKMEQCEKIKGEKFKDLGSNPPRDKCYLQIAENTGNLEACKRIKGGPMSYTVEECILSTSLIHQNPAGCKMLKGEDRRRCASELGEKITADKVIEVDQAIRNIEKELKKGKDADLEKQLQGLQTKRKEMVDVMSPANKKEYDKQTDPTNRVIIEDFTVGTIDSATKNKLIDLNERLKAAGSKLTEEQYKAVRDYYKFINDPKNNVENMTNKELADDRWDDTAGKIWNSWKIWRGKDSAEDKAADEQLRFYERMLARQAAINDAKTKMQENFERNVGVVGGATGDKAKDVARDLVVQTVLGKAAGVVTGAATNVANEALEVVKGAAKSAEFRGLVKAYSTGMTEEMSKNGGDVERAHVQVMINMNADPYHYTSRSTLSKFGNILENKDCDGTNPHCIQRDVFWKAMKKSYQYQHPVKK